MRVLFAGTPEFATYSLRALLDAAGRVDVVAVYTQPDRPSGRGRKLQPGPVKQLAFQHSIAVFQPEDLRSESEINTLRELAPDLVVVTAYGLLLPQDVLDIPQRGCVNVHASLLPRWRGAAPIQRCIQAGDTHTGVCLMKMEAGLDTGPVLATKKILIDDEDTGGSLHDRLALCSRELLFENIRALAEGSLQAVPQSEFGITYAHKLTKAESEIDWSTPAIEIERTVRAFDPWPGTFTMLGDMRLRVRTATALMNTAASGDPGRVLAADRSGITVECGTGAICIGALQKSGGKVISAADFLNGVSLPSGTVLGS
ncbi:MAG: methionyl-tRNA formyltransferase [Pseudomonadota bacterium]